MMRLSGQYPDLGLVHVEGWYTAGLSVEGQVMGGTSQSAELITYCDMISYQTAGGGYFFLGRVCC